MIYRWYLGLAQQARRAVVSSDPQSRHRPLLNVVVAGVYACGHQLCPHWVTDANGMIELNQRMIECGAGRFDFEM